MANRTRAELPPELIDVTGATGEDEPTEVVDPPRLCAVCSDPVERSVEHWLHEEGCSLAALADAEHVPRAVEVREALDACDCDLVAHAGCCPDCKEEADQPATVTHAECSDWCPYRGLSGHLPVNDEGAGS